MIRCIVVFAVLLMSQAAYADDGFTLLKECKAFANGDNVSEESVLGTTVKLWTGCPASFESALSSDIEVSSIRQVCLPGSAKNGQLAKIIVKYLEDHPEYLNRDEFELVREAFHRYFPCSIMDQLKHWKIISK